MREDRKRTAAALPNEAVFSNPEYLVAADTRISPGKDFVFVTVKSNAELNAMASPPDNPFTFTAEVTMTNDAGQTATGTITYRTHYAKDSDEGQE